MLEGMLRQVTVVSATPPAVMPPSDIAVDLAEFAFTMPDSVPPGFHVIEVRNRGSQPHMALLWRLEPGRTLAETVHWLVTPSDTGPPPVTLAGGTPDLDPGRAVQLLVDLEAGRYLLICLVDDAPGHQPHFALGMVREFAVWKGAAR